MPQTKATKKFEKNKLKDVLKKRKEVSKVKQRKQMTTKRKERNARDFAPNDGSEETSTAKPNNQENAFSEMTTDEFFSGGFQVPSAKQKTGKRKRPDKPSVDISKSEDDSDDEEKHKQELAALEKRDPSFHQYLKENDPELLDFEDADLAEIDTLSASEDEETPRKKRKSAQAEEEVSNELSIEVIKKWKAAMEEKKSLRATREVVLAFRAAVNDDPGKSYKYAISDSDVYHETLITALDLVPKVLQHHLPIKESGKVRVPTDSKKFRTLTPLLKSHAIAVHHLLENLTDGSTQRLTLESLTALLPYILSFKKVIREIIQVVASVWADNNTEITRLTAFLVLRRLMVISDASIREVVLKQTYQSLVKASRNINVHNYQASNLMKNTGSELWGLDANIGFKMAFNFIRQLAIHLRQSLLNKSADSHKQVYNWQFVSSLDFWSRVVSVHCESLREAEVGKESALRQLIYPICQLGIGTLRLIPTAQFFPLHFQITRSLLRISSATSTYIPLAPALVEILNSKLMKKPAQPSTLKALEFTTSIRASKSYLRTRTYQDGVGEQISELLSEYFVLWSKNIAFPELSLPVVVILKRWLKAASKRSSGNKNPKVNNLIQILIQKIEANSKWIEEKRSSVDFAPDNRAGVESFLKDVEWEKTPLGAFVAGQRKSREQKAKMEEAARKTQDRKRREAEKAEAEEYAEKFSDDEAAEDDSDDDGDVEMDELDGFSGEEEEEEGEDDEDDEEDEDDE